MIAARQFAALLLNLAAGDLSDNMSYSVGLSGSEVLQPNVYNMGVVGTNVDAANQWIRAQFPDRKSNGTLGGANLVADAINNRGPQLPGPRNADKRCPHLDGERHLCFYQLCAAPSGDEPSPFGRFPLIVGGSRLGPQRAESPKIDRGSR